MTDIISWDKAIGRKVKSREGGDLGKVQAITRDYIQTKDGIISKKYYFIPNYYLSGYDGDSLWVSLAKDEAKSRFEREKAPELAEWETKEYAEHKAEVTERYQEFATSIPYMMQLPWDKMIGKKVRSSDGKDVGDVESVASDYIEVKEGVVSKTHYYIPKQYIHGFDGSNLYATLAKDQVEKQFERDSPPPPEVRIEEQQPEPDSVTVETRVDLDETRTREDP
jgi:hypothetical protein